MKTYNRPLRYGNGTKQVFAKNEKFLCSCKGKFDTAFALIHHIDKMELKGDFNHRTAGRIKHGTFYEI